MIEHRRPVRFEDVDAARVVFFAHYARYVHEAMEAFFDAMPGGYAGLVTTRNLGFPTVRLDGTYRAPLRYGEAARIRVTVEHVGRSSAGLRYVFSREPGGGLVYEASHTVVACTMSDLVSQPLPDDVRAHLEAHRA